MKAALSVMADSQLEDAARPLIEQGWVDALVWAPETGWGPKGLSRTMSAWLKDFERRGELYGHSNQYSLLSAPLAFEHNTKWLRRLAYELTERRFTRFSEHFGYFAVDGFPLGAPLPLPYSDLTLALGRERLRRLHDLLRVPIGLENLALVFSRHEALEQGAFVEALLLSIDGYVVLDIHNLYCQVQNFGLSWRELLVSWPLHRVREIHISGGSVSWHEGETLRRDTHDDRVPEELWQVLPQVLRMCPLADLVVFERLPSSLVSARDKLDFEFDFLRMKHVLQEFSDDRCLTEQSCTLST